MLFADIPHGYSPSIAVYYRATEYTFALKDALRVMSERTMPSIRKHFLGCVEPVVDRLIVLGLAAPNFYARKRVVMWVH
jgi:hypothetical protein